MNKFLLTFFGGLWMYSSVCLAVDLDSLVAIADVDKGEQIAATCQACHAVKAGDSRNMLGPSLFDVVGRKIASVESYNYSSTLSAEQDAAYSTWSFKALDQFLRSPEKMFPGTKMVFPGFSQAADRAAVIAWLRLQSDQPVQLVHVSNADKINAAAAAVESTVDPDLALLPEGIGREAVFYNCSTCHSVKLVVQQGMSRVDWDDTLQWMIEDQEMSELDTDTYKLILDYLSEHFGINR